MERKPPSADRPEMEWESLINLGAMKTIRETSHRVAKARRSVVLYRMSIFLWILGYTVVVLGFLFLAWKSMHSIEKPPADKVERENPKRLESHQPIINGPNGDDGIF
jgi:hypothetical protein